MNVRQLTTWVLRTSLLVVTTCPVLAQVDYYFYNTGYDETDLALNARASAH